MDRKIKVKGTGSRCILEGYVKGYVKDNYFARFHTRSLAGITDAEKTKLRHKNEQSQWTVKYRSRAPGQGACLKGMSRTITLQGFTFLALTNVEKTKLKRKC